MSDDSVSDSETEPLEWKWLDAPNYEWVAYSDKWNYFAGVNQENYAFNALRLSVQTLSGNKRLAL